MICKTGKFSILEQLWMQITFNGVWVIGSISIFLFSPLITMVYFLFVIIGIVFFIMHLWICPRCPHIRDHQACVQLHPSITKLIIKKNVSGELRLLQKMGFFIFLYGVFFIPLVWVIRNQYVLITYLILGLMHYLAYYFHFCKECLNVYCPHKMLFNSTHGT